MHLAVDLIEHFIEMLPPANGPYALDTPLAAPGCKHRPEPMPPASDGLVPDLDTKFVKQIFSASKQQWEADAAHHRQADDLEAGLEGSKGCRVSLYRDAT